MSSEYEERILKNVDHTAFLFQWKREEISEVSPNGFFYLHWVVEAREHRTSSNGSLISSGSEERNFTEVAETSFSLTSSYKVEDSAHQSNYRKKVKHNV